MHVNVEITAWRGREIVERRVGHNIWVNNGRRYLAQAISFTSPISGTSPGSVDLVSDYPEITNQFFYIRIGHAAGVVEYRVQLASPANSGLLLTQINAQVSGLTASLGAGNGLVFTPDAPTGIEIVGGSALLLLGLVPVKVPPAGLTTTPLETRRIKYMGFGIGSKLQNTLIAEASPLSTSYPDGADPHGTDGKSYDKLFPDAPLISSLERPVRVTGGTTAYPGDLGDVWLVESPKFANYILSPGVMRFHGVLDGTAGDVVYAPFTIVPLSEVGLFLSDADVEDAYNVDKLVAYYSFGTIQLDANIRLELIWTVSF